MIRIYSCNDCQRESGEHQLHPDTRCPKCGGQTRFDRTGVVAEIDTSKSISQPAPYTENADSIRQD